MPSEIWVMIELARRADTMSTPSRELLGKGRELADASATRLAALLIGSGVQGLAEQAFAYGADRAYVVDDSSLARYTTDGFVGAAVAAVRAYQPELVLTGPGAQMRDFSAALAAALDVGLAAGTNDVTIAGEQISATRSSHSGAVQTTLVFDAARPAVVSVHPRSFPEAPAQPGRDGEVITIAMPPIEARTRVLSVTPRDQPVEQPATRMTLSEATVVVSGGRGLGSPENYHRLIPPLADALGGTYGGSGAIVAAGWVPLERKVGLTGKTVRPRLYVAVGLSGAVQHRFGMRSSQTVVAINQDPDAPIFRAATYGIVGDVNEIVPLLTEEIRARAGE